MENICNTASRLIPVQSAIGQHNGLEENNLWAETTHLLALFCPALEKTPVYCFLFRTRKSIRNKIFARTPKSKIEGKQGNEGMFRLFINYFQYLGRFRYNGKLLLAVLSLFFSCEFHFKHLFPMTQ